jgi:hypothetical protein
MVGGLGALAALYTGSMARAAVKSGDFVVAINNFKQVLAMHENFAHLSAAIFGILAASYLFLWMLRENFSVFAEKIGLGKLWNFLLKVAHIFAETRLVIFMAITGLICITITGSLGGVMVYGPLADPFFGIVYKLLFPSM